MCAGNELFYAALYLLNFTSGPFYMFNISKFLLCIILKRVFRFYAKTYEVDVHESFNYFSVAMVCFPIAIAKSAIALLQGYLACVNLGSVDVMEREAARRREAVKNE